MSWHKAAAGRSFCRGRKKGIFPRMRPEQWNTVLEKIALTIDAQRFETWLRPLSVDASTTDSALVLAAPNLFMRDFLHQHYRDTVLSVVKSVAPAVASVSFVAATGAVPDDGAARPERIAAEPRARSSKYPTLNKRYTFESFVVGAGNEFPKSAALAVAQSPGKTKFNPLLIYGGVGLGKTHLLQAIGNHVVGASGGNRVSYVSSEEFYLEFIDAIKSNTTKSFSDKYRTSDVLLVDDIQFFAGKESTQEEFFYIFNALYHNGKQIVLTSDLPPSSLRGLQDRLVSRFHWGLCVDIQPPDLETRVAILKRKAEEESLSIPENVLYFIAEKIASNIRELEGVVIRLLAFASITKSDITLDLVASVIKKSFDKGKSKISIEEIIQTVASFYKVPVDTVREKNRRKEVALCRHVAMYIAKSVTNNSLKTIGLNFGGRDHSTVIYAVHSIEDLRKNDPSVAKDITFILSQLKE